MARLLMIVVLEGYEVRMRRVRRSDLSRAGSKPNKLASSRERGRDIKFWIWMDGFASVMSSYSGNKAQLTRTYVDEGGREKSIIRRILRLLKRTRVFRRRYDNLTRLIQSCLNTRRSTRDFFLCRFLYKNCASLFAAFQDACFRIMHFAVYHIIIKTIELTLAKQSLRWRASSFPIEA